MSAENPYWQMVTTMQGGVSRKVFEKTKGDYQRYYHEQFDARDYATALSESGYPLLQEWISGNWSVAAIEEFLTFIKAAVRQSSFPMMGVVGIASLKERRVFAFLMLKHPGLYEEVKRVVERGMCWQELRPYIQVLQAPVTQDDLSRTQKKEQASAHLAVEYEAA